MLVSRSFPLPPGTVTTAELADDAVTTPKLVDGAVTGAKVLDGTITDADVAAANKDGGAGVPSLRTLGTGATQAAPGTTLATAEAYTDSVVTAGTVPNTRQVISGAGLTGGGDLSANRTLAVGAGTGIVVNADDVAVDTSVIATKAFASAGDAATLVTAEAYTDAAVASEVPTSRQIVSGGGLTGGGDLSANRTLNVGAGTGIVVNADDVAVDTSVIATRAYADTGDAGRVPTSRQVLSGGGLTGGGDLSADRTLAVGAGTGIIVNADDVAVDTSVISTKAYVNSGDATTLSSAEAYADLGDSNLAGAVAAAFVPNARQVLAGAGLTGGGTLAADRTFNVGANGDGSIVVNADDIQVGVLATNTQHGARGGGTQHANVISDPAGTSGFMSSANARTLDLLNLARTNFRVVSTDGSDTEGNGTFGKPYLTYATALTGVSANTVIVFLSGTYTAANGHVVPTSVSGLTLWGFDPHTTILDTSAGDTLTVAPTAAQVVARFAIRGITLKNAVAGGRCLVLDGNASSDVNKQTHLGDTEIVLWQVPLAKTSTGDAAFLRAVGAMDVYHPRGILDPSLNLAGWSGNTTIRNSNVVFHGGIYGIAGGAGVDVEEDRSDATNKPIPVNGRTGVYFLEGANIAGTDTWRGAPFAVVDATCLFSAAGSLTGLATYGTYNGVAAVKAPVLVFAGTRGGYAAVGLSGALPPVALYGATVAAPLLDVGGATIYESTAHPFSISSSAGIARNGILAVGTKFRRAPGAGTQASGVVIGAECDLDLTAGDFRQADIAVTGNGAILRDHHSVQGISVIVLGTATSITPPYPAGTTYDVLFTPTSGVTSAAVNSASSVSSFTMSGVIVTGYARLQPRKT